MASRRLRIVTESNIEKDKLDELGQSITGVNTNPEDWRRLVEDARVIIHLGEQNIWAKADIAAEAANSYGRLKDLCEELKQPYGYWRVLSHVGQQYSKEEREKYMSLSFAHFQVVSGKENRLYLLKKANDEGWSVGQLKKAAAPTTTSIDLNVNDNDNADNDLDFGRVGITASQTVELLNWFGKLDRDVAVGIGMARRPCNLKLDNWIAETLAREPAGVGVLDILNILFVGQGTITFNESEGELFSLEI